MPTCGHCQREIVFATGEDGKPIALDKLETYEGERYTLMHQGTKRPTAIPITRPGYFAGYRPHDSTCGKGTVV